MNAPSLGNYVDGFLIPVRTEALDRYREVAEKCAAIWKEFGAIAYVETVIDHDGIEDLRAFGDAAAAGPGETVVLAWIVYPSKEIRDEANAKVRQDERLRDLCGGCDELFDCARMAYGGFKPIVAH